MDKNLKCPVCKGTEKIHIVYVPGGHGRWCQYICLDCKIQFPWGSNKFGDITNISQIKKVRQLYFTDNYDRSEDIEPSAHPDYKKEKAVSVNPANDFLNKAFFGN